MCEGVIEMAKQFEFTGKTVEDAVKTGLTQLGLTKETADVEVLDEGGKGFIVKTKAKVRISKKESDGERAIAFIDALLSKMGWTATSDLVEEGERIVINLVATNSSALIGYRGEVLDALQCLAGAVANTGREDYRRVVVDCENYREKREETLTALAKKIADKAVKYGRKVSLEPMNPYERRIIHSALADSTEVKTVSEGREPNRYIVVIPNNLKPQRERRDFGNKGGFNRDKKYGDRNGSRGGFNRDNREGRGDRKPYGDRERKPYGDRGPRPAKKNTVTSFQGFGGFVGNSLKENEEKKD